MFVGAAFAGSTPQLRTTIDLHVRGKADGRVLVIARLRGDRVITTFAARRLHVVAHRRHGPRRITFAAATLCAGRVGPRRAIASVLQPAARPLNLRNRTVALAAHCPAKRPLGVLVQVRVVAGKGRTVLIDASGSIPDIRDRRR